MYFRLPTNDRYAKQLEAALKKKRLITRGAAAGVDPNVRNALYLADTADVSEEDIFGNPELMPKLSAALKTITKRKRVKGKPLVELIATVQKDGSLPACVQAGSSGAPSTATSTTLGGGGSANRLRAAGVTPGMRRHQRPPALLDALATSHEEYAANMEQAYGSVQRPGSAASASNNISPALATLDVSNSSAEDYVRHGWGHNNGGGSGGGYGIQQFGGSTRSAPPSVRGLPGGTVVDSPASSCTTLVAGSSPVEGSLSGGFSPATKDELSPAPGAPHLAPSRFHQGTDVVSCMPEVGMRSAIASGGRIQLPSSAPSAGGGHHWGSCPSSTAGGLVRTHAKRVSVASSVASTDVETLDTSHLLEFDDDDDDDGVVDDAQLYNAGGVGNVGYSGGPALSSGAGGGAQGVSLEDLQELEDALLMDNIGAGNDDFLAGEDNSTGTFGDANGQQGFPDLRNVGASLPPLPRAGHALGGQRGTPRSGSAGGAGSPHISAQGIGASPSNAGSASPVSGAALSLGSNNGPPRHGQRGINRSRSQVPPRPYTPGKTSRGMSTPWLSHGLGGGVSPRVGSSPRPLTPGNSRRRAGDEAFPEHAGLPATNDPGVNGVGGPSPKARRVGARTFPERFPGSPQSGVSPRVGFPQVSPRNAEVSGNFSLGTCSIDGGGGADRTYFPAPAAAAAVVSGGISTGSPAHQSRGHRRSNSSSWGSGSTPRHGGMNECSVDAASSENMNVSVGAGYKMPGTSQNWSSRLGEGGKISITGASCGRQSWCASPSGDTQTVPPAPSPRASVSGPGGSIGPVVKAQVPQGHGALHRRHSSPIPSIQTFQITPGSLESMGEGSAAILQPKNEFTMTEYTHEESGNRCNTQSVEGGGGGGVLSAGGWVSPPPMLESDGLWPMMTEGQHESSRAMSEASAAAVAAVAAAAVPSSGTMESSTVGNGGNDVFSPRMATTMEL